MVGDLPRIAGFCEKDQLDKRSVPFRRLDLNGTIVSVLNDQPYLLYLGFR